jgi:hypothetical protein
VFTLGVAACGERAQRAEADRTAMADATVPDDASAPARPPMDPCALLTTQEISEQLLLTVSPSQRTNWSTTEFDVRPTEVDWGMSRRCEIAYQSRHQVSGGAAVRGGFNVMVFGREGLGVPEDQKRPVAGAGPEVFKHQEVFYVTKGDYAVSLTDFKGTYDSSGDENAGRVALLRAAAGRLP